MVTLKAARVNVGLTQGEAAEKLGVSLWTLSAWERGLSYPNVPRIKDIEKLYHVSFNDLIF